MSDGLPIEERTKSVYLAGPLGSNDWRLIVVQGLHDRSWNWSTGEPFPVLRRAIFGKFDYLGPYWPHYKKRDEHGTVWSHINDMRYRWRKRGRRLEHAEFYDQCKSAIQQADVVFCAFPGNNMDAENPNSHDTDRILGELFYACAHGKTIFVSGKSPVSYELEPETMKVAAAVGSPRRALAKFLGVSSKADLNFDAGHGFVYFIENLANRHIKIGWAKKPEDRRKSFQTGSSTKIRLLGKVPGSRHLERKIQADFHSFRVKGEWFFGVESIRNFIKEETACSSACD